MISHLQFFNEVLHQSFSWFRFPILVCIFASVIGNFVATRTRIICISSIETITKSIPVRYNCIAKLYLICQVFFSIFQYYSFRLFIFFNKLLQLNTFYWIPKVLINNNLALFRIYCYKLPFIFTTWKLLNSVIRYFILGFRSNFCEA